MHPPPHRRTHGFTIVELLIVIVVIAVLATVTVVAYNGVQQRARNTSRIAAAKGYVNLLSMYRTTNGSYPFTSGHYCLGTGFPDVNSDGVGDCYNAQTGDGWLTSVNSTINTQLATIGTLPDSPKGLIVGTDGIPRVGPLANWKADGYLYVYYILERTGSEVCPYGTTEWSTTNTLICQVQLGQ